MLAKEYGLFALKKTVGVKMEIESGTSAELLAKSSAGPGVFFILGASSGYLSLVN